MLMVSVATTQHLVLVASASSAGIASHYYIVYAIVATYVYVAYYCEACTLAHITPSILSYSMLQ